MLKHITNKRFFAVSLILLAGAATFLVAASNEKSGESKQTALDFEQLQKKLAEGKPIIWLFTGDSITHGWLHTHGWRSYPEHFAERIRGDLKRFRDVIINTGISGNKTDQLLGDLQWRVLQFKPDVVSLMYGMAQATNGKEGLENFRKDLKELIKKIREIGAIPILNTTNTICSVYDNRFAELPAYNQIIYEIAKQENVILVDHWSHWKKCRPVEKTLIPWLNDDIHPNNYGHIEFTKEIFRTLNIFDSNSPTCQLNVP